MDNRLDGTLTSVGDEYCFFIISGGLCMQIKKKQAKNGKPLSMGFGFVEFDTVDTAKMVCQNLQVLLHCFLLFCILLCSFFSIVPCTAENGLNCFGASCKFLMLVSCYLGLI